MATASTMPTEMASVMKTKWQRAALYSWAMTSWDRIPWTALRPTACGSSWRIPPSNWWRYTDLIQCPLPSTPPLHSTKILWEERWRRASTPRCCQSIPCWPLTAGWTVGGVDNTADVNTIGLDFGPFEGSGGAVVADDVNGGSVFIYPDLEPAAFPDADGHVLIAQLTTDGEVSMTVNLQNAEGRWRESADPATRA